MPEGQEEGGGGALTSKMLRSVIIHILIALVVILFWSVLFPLSSSGSSDLLDKSQEAVHLSLPAPPGSASPGAEQQPSGSRVGGARTPNPEPGAGGRATLPSASGPPGRDFSRGGEEKITVV